MVAVKLAVGKGVAAAFSTLRNVDVQTSLPNIVRGFEWARHKSIFARWWWLLLGDVERGMEQPAAKTGPVTLVLAEC